MGEGAAGCFGRSSDKGVEMKTFGWREIDSSLFRGYIDESYNDQVLVLSCLIAGAHSWLWIGWDWEECIERWNRRLKDQGRQTISRYHATYCGNLKDEFEGWSIDEQKELTGDLIEVLDGHPLHTLSFAIDMEKFHAVFPNAEEEARPDVTGFICGMATKFLVYTLADQVCPQRPDADVSLVHDKCPYDAVMSDAFKQCVADADFKYPDNFSTFESKSTQDCTPLEPTDFLAYINFKESLGMLSGKKRSKPLEILISLETFGGGIKFLGEDALKALKEWFESHSQSAVE